MAFTNEDKNSAAAAASSFLKGKISDEQLNASLDVIKSGSGDSVSAQGDYICAVFYWRVVLNSGNYQFKGNAGGVGGIGGGSTNGTIYLASGVSFQQLVSNTDSFQFNAVVGVYLNVNFFDSGSNFLGSYQGGGVGTCGGTGGGSGSWSQV